MKKIKFLFIALALILLVSSTNTFLYAQDNIENAEKENKEVLNKEKEKEQKEEILKLIDECLEDISTRLINIDKKIDNTKKQKEFEYYPAIRLNIDTPLFGMSSLVENKLRVKKDISTSDVASRYSIRDIVQNKKIRLPDSILGSIVMTTKDYNIDENMELPQLKLTLVKCIQYLSQVNSADDFIDTQIYNIFRDYIDDNKKASIRDIKDRNNKVQKSLIEASDKIRILTLLGINVDDFSEKYFTISKSVYNINKKVKEMLVLNDTLTDLSKSSISNEVEILDLISNIDKLYDEAIENMDYGVLLDNLYTIYEEKTNNIREYIENSTTNTKEMVDEKEEVKTITNYDVTSIVTLDYMQIILEDIDTQRKEYRKSLELEKEDKIKEEQNENKQEENDKKDEITKEDLEKSKEKIIEENKQKIQVLYSKYKEVLGREHKFYTSNINMLLKDSNNKMTSIIYQIDSGIEINNDIFNYTKYIYIDLPERLSNYIDENNLNSTLELNNLIKNLKKELNNLSNINKNITKMHNNMIEESLKS